KTMGMQPSCSDTVGPCTGGCSATSTDQPVTTRDALPADLDRVTEIKVASWRDTYSALLPPAILAPFLDQAAQLEYLRRAHGDPGTLLLVAEHDGQGVIGFALTHTDAQPDPWLESL